MKIQRSIMLKAAFLILVFFLNTVVGFACAIGADMGFNGMHHQEKPGVHHHVAGQKEHHAAANQIAAHQKDNCCKDEVSKLTTADKEAQSVPGYSFQHSVSAIFPAPVYFQDSLNFIPANIPNTYFARHSRAPIPDVRIAIQSFQI
jgi:hypothetical protein